jgi:hypothetical protein
MRWDATPDANQAEIVAALEKIGCSVVSLHRVGNIPDLLVGRAKCNWLMEVKTAKGRLNDDQKEFHSSWRGQVCVVRSALEAVAVINGKT